MVQSLYDHPAALLPSCATSIDQQSQASLTPFVRQDCCTIIRMSVLTGASRWSNLARLRQVGATQTATQMVPSFREGRLLLFPDFRVSQVILPICALSGLTLSEITFRDDL